MTRAFGGLVLSECYEFELNSNECRMTAACKSSDSAMILHRQLRTNQVAHRTAQLSHETADSEDKEKEEEKLVNTDRGKEKDEE